MSELNFKPMLAYNQPINLYRDIKYPVAVTIKYDGIRAYKLEGKARTRTGKKIPNLHIRQQLRKLPDGVDGEIVIEGKTFHEIQSAVMTKHGAPQFRYIAFDLIEADRTYLDRMMLLQSFSTQYDNTCPFDIAFPLLFKTPEEVEVFAKRASDEGYEGIILRNPQGLYKQGRSTLREGLLIKYVEWQRAEATIVGFEEWMTNTDTSCHRKANLVPGNKLGAFIVKKDETTFRIGSGFDNAFRIYVWMHKEEFVGQTITYKYKSMNKDAPREPIFVGIRED